MRAANNINTTSPIRNSDWYFIPTALYAATGVMLGLVIGNFIGLI